MYEAGSHDVLIRQLSAGLRPVRRLWSPARRTALWAGAMCLMALLLLWRFGDQLLLQRWQQQPSLAWAAGAAVVTALCAGFATFEIAVPGRTQRWIWLPWPAACCWLAASGVGCLGQWLTGGPTSVEGFSCLYFILVCSLPLSLLQLWLLRRAAPQRPALAAAMLGLGSAAASTALLEICHRGSAAFTDLAIHLLAIAMVVCTNLLLGGRLLGFR